MSGRISPRVRVIALVGLAAAVALGAGMMFVSPGQSSAVAAPKSVAELRAAKNGAAPTPAAKRPVAAEPKRTPAKTKPAPVTPKPAAPKPTAPTEPAVEGLPAAVAKALRKNRVVVVSLFAPDGAVDAEALKEARSGAARGRAAFVALDVSKESQIAPLTKLLGVLDVPSLLVVTGPDDVFVRISGFVDRDTVAQAAANAALALPAGDGGSAAS